MLSDSELEGLAKSLLEDLVTEIGSWTEGERKPFYAVSKDAAGNLVLTYAGRSTEGYGTFTCEYAPIEAIKAVIRHCERISEQLTVELTNTQTGEINAITVGDPRIPGQEELIETMAGTASAYVLAHLTARFGQAIEELLRDSDLIAQSVLAISTATVLKEEGIDLVADASEEIEIAAQRAANMKRELLRSHLKELPHMIVQRGRGRKPKPAAERERQRQEYSAKVESAYRSLRLKKGKRPTKTSIAKELGEGGINPKTFKDLSLQAFRAKLDRWGIDYDAIVLSVESELNAKS